MKIDKITGSVPNCIACQIAYDITPYKINSLIRCSRFQSDKYQHVNHNR